MKPIHRKIKQLQVNYLKRVIRLVLADKRYKPIEVICIETRGRWPQYDYPRLKCILREMEQSGDNALFRFVLKNPFCFTKTQRRHSSKKARLRVIIKTKYGLSNTVPK